MLVFWENMHIFGTKNSFVNFRPTRFWDKNIVV